MDSLSIGRLLCDRFFPACGACPCGKLAGVLLRKLRVSQEKQSGIGWIARSDIGKLGSTGETHSALQAHARIPFCGLELEFNSNERREFRMLPKSVWPVFLHGRAVCQCPYGNRRANLPGSARTGQALKRPIELDRIVS